MIPRFFEIDMLLKGRKGHRVIDVRTQSYEPKY
jgi:hypothetical protein